MLLRSLGFLLLFAAPALAFAEEADERASAAEYEPPVVPIRLGIGVSLSAHPFMLVGDDATVGLPVGFANLLLPVRLGEHLRIEPEVGFYHQSGGFAPGVLRLLLAEGLDMRTTVTRIGLGVQWAWPVMQGAEAFFGPKIGLQQRSTHIANPLTDPELDREVDALEISTVDYWAGLVLGGEAFIHRALSLGAEVQFSYINLGKASLAVGGLGVDPDQLSDEESKRQWLLSTTASFSVRFYFL